jgi:hypothetical protein
VDLSLVKGPGVLAAKDDVDHKPGPARAGPKLQTKPWTNAPSFAALDLGPALVQARRHCVLDPREALGHATEREPLIAGADGRTLPLSLPLSEG